MVAIREAATVLLLADRPGPDMGEDMGEDSLHVFMQRRHHAMVFTPGATVFPGGAVDPVDSDPHLYERVVGLRDAEASAVLGVPRDGLRFWLAAFREAFEESGLFLVTAPFDEARAAADRDELNAGRIDFLTVLRRHDAMLDARNMHVFSHWLTPEGAPRRYDTWFFVAPAPSGQEGSHDHNESVQSEWVRPGAMLDAFARGDADLIFPTMRSLQAIEGYARAADVLAAASGASTDRNRTPAVISDSSGQRIALTEDERILATPGWVGLRSQPNRDREAFTRDMEALIARRLGPPEAAAEVARCPT